MRNLVIAFALVCIERISSVIFNACSPKHHGTGPQWQTVSDDGA